MQEDFLANKCGTNINLLLENTYHFQVLISGNGESEEQWKINVIQNFAILIFSIYLVPERNLILSANKAIHKISREEYIAIIKQFNFALEPTLYIFTIFAIFYFYISFAI